MTETCKTRPLLPSPADTARGTVSVALSATRADRDLRIDFFRGLALIFIFIDHMAGNGLMHLTMRAFGLSDAAEVFVLLAGVSATFAYSGKFDRFGVRKGMHAIALRVRDLYVAHILLVAVSALFLASVARWFENPLYFEYVNLTPLSYDPWSAIWRFLVLSYQPGYLNILPLYMVLLALFPLIWWGMRRNDVATLAASAALWLLVSLKQINLPSWPEVFGWYFNPLAWQLLFAIGVFTANRARAGATLSRSPLLIVPAVMIVAIGFVVAAPWINIPGLNLPRLVPYDALGPVSKTYVSAWRLAHVLSVAYLTLLLVPASARWLRSRFAEPLIHCGRNSLDIFCLGTVFSFIGFSVLLEAGRTWEFQLLVNVVGISAMLITAKWLSRRKVRGARGAVIPASAVSSVADLEASEAK